MRRKAVVAILIIGGAILLTVAGIWLPGRGPGGSIASGGQPVIAFVRIDGVLVTGLGQESSLLSASAGSDSIVATLTQVRENPSVRAVVLRVNSPGGSPAAAQEITDEIGALRAAGKVVVTSMGDVAASGAYWIAATTDHIVADPGTLTGSIGVIWEIPNYEELYKKLGISYQTLTSGPHKDMGSTSRPLTDEERRIIRSMIDDLYNQFVDTVAAGRHLPRESVVALADGRVFTGTQAKAAGLVDSLGGYRKAIENAAELAGIEGNYRVEEFGRKTVWELLLGEVRGLLRGLRVLQPSGSGLLEEGPR